jgi:hypothetical protein
MTTAADESRKELTAMSQPAKNGSERPHPSTEAEQGAERTSRVIDLDAARRRRSLEARRPQMPSDGPHDGDAPQLRARQNAIGGLIVVGLIVFGLWLFFEIRTAVRTELCIEAGLRDCNAIAHGTAR